MTGRARQMARRLARTLGRAGLDPEDVRSVAAAYDLAVGRRVRRLANPHNPRLLHPGRTLLVLLGDVRLADPRLLAAAALLESADPGLAVPDADVVRALGLPTAAALRALPVLPGGLRGPATASEEQAWARALDVLPPPELAVVLAEALDQARHLHLLPPSEGRRRAARRVGERLRPLTPRVTAGMGEGGRTLQRRFEWWWRRVGRELSGRATEGPRER